MNRTYNMEVLKEFSGNRFLIKLDEELGETLSHKFKQIRVSDTRASGDESLNNEPPVETLNNEPPVETAPPCRHVTFRRYPAQDVNPKSEMQVFVSHIINPEILYVQDVSSEAALDAMRSSINKISQNLRPVQINSLSAGYAVLARYPVDGLLYRGLIKCLLPGKALVFLVDYGAFDTLDLTELFEIPTNLLTIPPIAIQIFLSDVMSFPQNWMGGCYATNPLAIIKTNEVYRMNILAITIIDFDVQVSAELICLDGVSLSQKLAKAGLVSIYPHISDPQTPRNESLDNGPTVQTSQTPKTISFGGYPAQNVSPNSEMKVIVSYVVDPKNYYVQDVNCEAALRLMRSSIDKLRLNLHPVNADSLTPGFPVLARFPEDGLLYRALIKDLLPEEAVILYVDYGTIETQKLTELYYLPLKLLTTPPIALQIALRDVEPVKEKWSLENDGFINISGVFTLSILTVKLIDCEVKVSAFLTCPDGVSLSEKLAKAGHAFMFMHLSNPQTPRISERSAEEIVHTGHSCHLSRST